MVLAHMPRQSDEGLPIPLASFREFERLKFPHPNDLLTHFPQLSPHALSVLTPFFNQHGARDAAYWLSLARCLGMGPTALTTSDLPRLLPHPTAADILACRDNWFATVPDHAVLLSDPDPYSSLEVFRNRICVFPARFLRGDLADDQHCIVLRLPWLDQRECRENSSREIAGFAGLVFSKEGPRLIVSEILPPLNVVELQLAASRPQRCWFENLLLGLSAYARSIQNEAVGKITIPFETIENFIENEYSEEWLQEALIKTNHPGTSTELGLQTVAALLRRLGFSWDYSETQDVGGKSRIPESASLELQAALPVVFSAFDSSLIEQGRCDAERSVAKLRELFPIDPEPALEFIGVPVASRAVPELMFQGLDLTQHVRGAFELVPQCRIPLNAMEGMTSRLQELHTELVRTRFGNSFFEGNFAEFTFFTRGIERGTFAEWWELPLPGAPTIVAKSIHPEGQLRHPHIRIIRSRDGCDQFDIFSIGCKGGGLRNLSEQNDLVLPADGHLRAPIYRRRPALEGREIATHRYWGGLLRGHAESEFVHTLSLHEFGRTVQLPSPIPLPIPLDVGVPRMLPVWGGKRTTWLSPDEYRDQILRIGRGDPYEDPATYRSLSGCDVRWSQLLNMIFSCPKDSPGAEAVSARIAVALKLVYVANGFPFTPPTQAIETRSGHLQWRDLFRYLAHISEQNSASAGELYRKIESGLVSLMGMVHGSGGHLGGADLGQGTGAISGGALSLRNVDLQGVVHDLDQDIYFPVVRPIGSTLELRATQRYFLSDMQRADAIYLESSLDWIRNILLAPEPTRDRTLYNHRFGRYGLLPSFDPTPPNVDEVVRFQGKSLREATTKLATHFRRELYAQYFRRAQDASD